MNVQVGGYLFVDLDQELLELDSAVTGVQRADDLATGEFSSEQAARAVALVVVGGAGRGAGQIGNVGAVRSSAWIWDFSSTLSTIARSGGSR